MSTVPARTIRTAALALAGALAASALAGCAPEVSPAPANTTTTPITDPYAVVPEPGRTIAADPASAAERLDGYRIAVVMRDDSAPTRALRDGARAFAAARGAQAEEFVAATDDESGVSAALAAAIESGPDLVVGLGEGIVDTFSFETAQQLGTQFLVVGAQLAEPTDNVTAVIWKGATSRGSAASADGALDDATVTADRAEDALAAGIASIRDGVTGVVLDLGD